MANAIVVDPFKGKNECVVQGRLPKEIFKYFFRERFPGERGPQQALINTFFQRLHEACVQAGVPRWVDADMEDDGPQVVAKQINEILQRLNFNG